MFCPNCGEKIVDSNSNFCPVCGAAMGAVQEELVGNPSASVPGLLVVPWRGGQVAWAILFLVVGASSILLTAALILLLTGNLDQALIALVSSVLVGLLILVIIWHLGLRPPDASLSLLGLKPPRIPAGWATLWTVVALVLSFASTFLYSIIMGWLGFEELLPPESYTEIVFAGPAVVLTFMALALWTPFTEEIFFRGFVFTGLIHRRGAAGAIVSSAVIFSAFHLTAGPGVLIPIFITGLLLAWLYHHTGSLWTSIAAHSGQNGAALLATIYEPAFSELSAIILPGL